MKIFVVSTEYIIPWDPPCGGMQDYLDRALEEKERKRSIDEILAEAKANPFRAFGIGKEDTGSGWSNVPLVPVFDAPDDLLYLGFFVVYNGNHRRLAANKAGISIPILLLENDADLSALQKYRPKECKAVLEGLSFEETRKAIWDNARRYVNNDMMVPF